MQHEQLPGQAVQLLRVAAEESVDAGVRHMAAINFKNFVKRSWDKSEAHETLQGGTSTQYVIPDSDKEVVRQNILEAMIRAPHNIQSQLSEVFKIIVYCDYPEQWPGLLQALYGNLSAQSRVHGGLLALRLLARKYEFRDEEERAPLEGIITTAFPLLLHIFRQLLAAPPSAQISGYIKLVCKTFWSSTYMGVPAALLEPETFTGWMGALHSALTQAEPADVASLDPNDRPAAPWWKAKKWVLHITYRLYNRYGQPKNCRDGTEKPFAELYASECMMHFLDAHLGLMSQLAQGTYFSPRCTNLLFQYMSHAVNLPSCYKRVGSSWDQLLHHVAFPLMAFNDEDARLWAEDPQEYIRKGYDILEDMYSPKTAAANFAHDLCSKKRSHLDAFMSLVAGLLSGFGRTVGEGGVPTVAEARRVDGALLAVGCLAPLLKSKKPYKDQLGPIMATYVMPCFTSPHGHLRSKAVWVSGVFCDTTFPDGTNRGPTYMRFFEQVARCLGDPELPVRVDAVVSLRHFLEEMEDVEPVAPALPQLLNSIFGLMNQVDNEDLVFTLEVLVDKFGDKIGPYAVQMASQLTSAFWKYCAVADEDAEGDEDTAGIAAFGCMRALNTLLESCSDQPALVASLEEVLYPLMHRMLSTEGQDVFEEVLEMLSYLTYYGQSISERLWALWPQIEAAVNEWAVDYWENILVPLDNFISRDPERFLSSTTPDYRASLFGMVQGALKGDFGERDVVPAVRLLEVVLQNCRGRVDPWVGPYLQLALGKLQTATNRTLKDALVLVVANALYYNAALALSVLVQMGVVGQFFTAWFAAIFANKKSGKPKHFRRMHDKKVCVLGLVSMLAVPDEALPGEITAGLAQAGIMRLLLALKEQQAEMEEAAKAGSDDEEDEEDDEDEDGGEDVGEEDEEVRLVGLNKALRRGARDILDDGSEGSDDEFTDDEEVRTPIDPVDPFVFYADALSGLQQHMPARHQQLMATCDANTQAALAGMMAYAAELKNKPTAIGDGTK
ncbi:hypothetical protein VOLCADRAFT_79706 [Volvox carteri f. nagariensis]|uniref:Importin N-terminal domain-containing protein n=1 Tax=Volvox carteri f. nagariensis TaxID=3068 RepID=D8TM64_VOLCA|nr:uncharacterized protein VOLCADRAFT_79706 [Volvox carteri f. nagariensis]EFJ51590.1 hypothetical protein VOLCADRAFT_79706 [Volvox carteri f. nagariensis]|eukprot:XP_002947542.1 hypothetical protein VOLCADRAFT_79706 [Volvox carteri f. nagariensis]